MRRRGTTRCAGQTLALAGGAIGRMGTGRDCVREVRGTTASAQRGRADGARFEDATAEVGSAQTVVDREASPGDEGVIMALSWNKGPSRGGLGLFDGD